jgi:hypothetical protein
MCETFPKSPIVPPSPAAWSLTGNTGTDPGTDFLGTTDGQPLIFKTNNAEAMRIDQNGNVGLGATQLSARFTVIGASSQEAIVGSSFNAAGVGGASNNSDGVVGGSVNGNGVGGTSTTGAGVSGASSSGSGVKGNSPSSNGVLVTSSTGTGVKGTSTSGSGVAGSSGLNGVVGTSSQPANAATAAGYGRSIRLAETSSSGRRTRPGSHGSTRSAPASSTAGPRTAAPTMPSRCRRATTRARSRRATCLRSTHGT